MSDGVYTPSPTHGEWVAVLIVVGAVPVTALIACAALVLDLPPPHLRCPSYSLHTVPSLFWDTRSGVMKAACRTP